jgi:hypothetical protein
MDKMQYKGNIQDYIIKIEDSNYQVCLSRIAWREALYSWLNEDIEDQLFFSNLTPNNDTEYE